ncbi:MAG: Nif3-like dinuclear metal center hexameric protein, partial [Prolixibacteraceae bacterium]|nr:Nif3-like dinuclear metal center hexameric protein [Prolixibacteraceae bacterium]
CFIFLVFLLSLKAIITIMKEYISKWDLSRRRFIKNGTSVVIGAPVILTSMINNKFIMPSVHTCNDIADHLKNTETGRTIDWGRTTDTFKCGDPAKPVRKIAVAWKASWSALREAVDRGADMFISHESVCVNARNGSPEPEVVFALPSEKSKFEWLEKTGLVVYRCHDVWDRFPGTGIRDTWQKGLDIGDKIVVDEYPYYVTEVELVTVRELARHVLKQIQPLRQNGVMMSGDPDKKVSRIGTGTGQNPNAVNLWNLGADVGIMTDDGYLHVRIGVHANELDFPVIIVNHGVAEEWGIMNLAKYIKQAFLSVEVFHIPQFCPYEIVT